MIPHAAAAPVRGRVVEGDQRGRLLGFPTANVWLALDPAGPADGVYAGWLSRVNTDESWPAAISVGTNPTFAGRRARRIESHVLDHDDLELYDVDVEITLIAHLRGMVTFDSVDALVSQMHRDVAATRDVLGAHCVPAGGRDRLTVGA
jgi:riboflavin kinase/FMN adenylyltransferase